MPKTDPETFDLGARRAARAKALGGRTLPVLGEDGTVVQIPRTPFWDAAQYEQWVEGNGLTDLSLLKNLLPEEDFAKLTAMNLELGDLQDIRKELNREAKTDPESEGSSTP